MRSIYLDHNATTPLLPEATEAMRAAEREAFGNPSSAHHAGRAARRALDNAREQIAALINAAPDEITFTSGATEANNHAVLGRVRVSSHSYRSVLIASPLEHPCIVEPLRRLESEDHIVQWLPVDSRGIIANRPVPPDCLLVCVMLANHETGAIQPVRAITETLPSGTALHCDATQAVGKFPVNFRELGATTLSASAHKFGGPRGVGILVVKRGTVLPPLFHGGHQQQGRRPGTEPVPQVVGMAAALEHAVRNMEANHSRLEALRARLWAKLRESASPVVLNGPEIGADDVIPTTLNVSFPGCRADLLLPALDLAGVACSTGSACSSGSLLPSPVLRAMGVSEDVLRSSLRFSFAASLDPTEIDDAATRIATVVAAARKRPV
jgi:cysteine desulfurase